MITVCAFNATKPANMSLINEMMKILGSEPYIIADLSTTRLDESKKKPGSVITIGSKAKRLVSEPLVLLELPSFEEIRKDVANAILELSKTLKLRDTPETLSTASTTPQIPREYEAIRCTTPAGDIVQVSTKPGDADINLTPQEINFIKSIMDIVGCDKVSAILKES